MVELRSRGATRCWLPGKSEHEWRGAGGNVQAENQSGDCGTAVGKSCVIVQVFEDRAGGSLDLPMASRRSEKILAAGPPQRSKLGQNPRGLQMRVTRACSRLGGS